MDDLFFVTRKMIRNGKYSIQQLAARMAKSENYMYRASMEPDNETSIDPPCRFLITVAKHQEDLNFIKTLCKTFGGVFVRIPRVAINKKDRRDLVLDYQDASNKAVRAIMNWLDNPDSDTIQIAKDAMDEMMRESAGIKKKIEKENPNQMDLFDLE